MTFGSENTEVARGSVTVMSSQKSDSKSLFTVKISLKNKLPSVWEIAPFYFTTDSLSKKGR